MSKSDLNGECSQCRNSGLSYCSITRHEAGIPAYHTKMVKGLCAHDLSYVVLFLAVCVVNDISPEILHCDIKQKMSLWGDCLSVGEVTSIVIRMAINKCFVINMIKFIAMFARCFNRGSAHYFL